jgi:hypothetical protein
MTGLALPLYDLPAALLDNPRLFGRLPQRLACARRPVLGSSQTITRKLGWAHRGHFRCSRPIRSIPSVLSRGRGSGRWSRPRRRPA